jgi:putative ABC transport system permease protein
MSTLRQIALVCALSLRSLPERSSTGMVIVVGLASVVAVLLSMLSVTAGFRRAYLALTSPTRAMVFSRDADNEFGSTLPRGWIGTIMEAPGIARGADGSPLADAELRVALPPVEGFVSGSLELRGLGLAGFEMRPELKVISGHPFRSGAREVVAGVAAARRFGLRVGSTVTLPDGQWPVVGIFSDGGAMLENELVADAATLMASTRRSAFAWVLVQLVNADAFPAFRAWLTANPAISVIAERQRDYELRRAGAITSFFTRMAYLIGAIMALGAVFGAVKIMHAAVRARTREIATLRAIGFDARAVAASVLLETTILAVAGAVLGAAIAWLLFDGHEIHVSGLVKLRVSAALVAIGLLWAVAVALLGGVLPALRAARVLPAEALRAG